MSKTIKFEKSITEIVEFDLTEKERIDLIKYMLYDLSTNKTLNKFNKDFIKGLKEAEQEFASDNDFIAACDVLLRKLH